MQKKLTKLQAYNAVAKLFQIYYDIDSSGDIGAILGSMAFLSDNTPADAAMFKDWERCLDGFLKYKNLRNYNYINLWTAFAAGGIFLEYFFGTAENSWEIQFFQENARLARDKKRVDPVLWQNWLRCVDEVLSVKDSREYFKLLPKQG